jgi:hypothetical protein
MHLRISWMGGLAGAVLTVPLFSFGALAPLAVCYNDGKAVLVKG